MKKLIVVLCLVIVSGCAVNTNRLKGYIGQGIRQVMIDYGRPVNVIDMGGGVRAYQFTESNTRVLPKQETVRTNSTTYGNTRTNGNLFGSSGNGTFNSSGRGSASTNTTQTYVTTERINFDCTYTLMTAFARSTGNWVVTEVKSPTGLRCR
jgi:hypothetical protein